MARQPGRRSSCASVDGERIPEARTRRCWLTGWPNSPGWHRRIEPAGQRGGGTVPGDAAGSRRRADEPAWLSRRPRPALVACGSASGVPGIWQQTLCELGVDSVPCWRPPTRRWAGVGRHLPLQTLRPTHPSRLSALAGARQRRPAPSTVTIARANPAVPRPREGAGQPGRAAGARLAASPACPPPSVWVVGCGNGERADQTWNSGSATLPQCQGRPDCRPPAVGWRWGAGRPPSPRGPDLRPSLLACLRLGLTPCPLGRTWVSGWG